MIIHVRLCCYECTFWFGISTYFLKIILLFMKMNWRMLSVLLQLMVSIFWLVHGFHFGGIRWDWYGSFLLVRREVFHSLLLTLLTIFLLLFHSPSIQSCSIYFILRPIILFLFTNHHCWKLASFSFGLCGLGNIINKRGIEHMRAKILPFTILKLYFQNAEI